MFSGFQVGDPFEEKRLIECCLELLGYREGYEKISNKNLDDWPGN